jgi:uncharacterized membrane protein
MDAAIPLLVLFVLAIPVVIVVRLFALGQKLRETTDQVEGLRQRLAAVEAKLRSSAGVQQSVPPVVEPLTRSESVGAVDLEPRLETFPAAPSPALPATEPWLEAAPSERLQPPLEETAPPVLEPAMSVQSAAAVPPPTGFTSFRTLNWEQFMGVKLFAWIGGFALFLAVAFFIKYSFERNLIPPEVRVAAGFAVGVGLLIGGVLMKRRELRVTAQTLCATGVVILYAVTFACRSVYHFAFFGPWPTFLLMMLITATAFSLAVRLNARVVAILGMVGGFLTPVLLSTGQDNPAALFTYIAVLDIGLMAIAFRQRWHFLILLSAIGTLLMQLGWAVRFFAPEKVFVAMAVFLGFSALYMAAFGWGEKQGQFNRWLTASSVGLPMVTMGFAYSRYGPPFSWSTCSRSVWPS